MLMKSSLSEQFSIQWDFEIKWEKTYGSIEVEIY